MKLWKNVFVQKAVVHKALSTVTATRKAGGLDRPKENLYPDKSLFKQS